MNVKRVGIYFLVLAMILTLSTPMYSFGAGRFSDTAGHWAERYINQAVEEGFVKGYPDGRFLPDKAVSRAEFTTMVNKALGNSGTTNLNFTDVPYGEWYYADVAKAVAATYVAGYDDNTFKPNSPISRQEAAVMISRFVPTFGESGNLRAYSDYQSIADWAYTAMQKVNGKGYIGAYDDGKIHPSDQLSRAQTAKIICDILDNENIVTSNTTVKSDGTKLSNKIYTNNVTIDSDLDDGSATIDNCIILGTLFVQGGGEDTITINNSRVSNVSVNKSGDPVRVLAKGETAISALSASRASILQTSSLTGGLYGPGFSKITIGSSADVTLKGSFPSVTISGSSAELLLESGSIKELTITSGGRSSEITVSSGTTVSNATVNAACSFLGTGTISHMAVNADGITYETKPRNWTIASRIDTPTKSDPELDIIFEPENGDTKVYVDTKITLTFSTAMTLSNGNAITSSNIDDFITLRKGSSSGTSVAFSATINSTKKVITITPDNNLAESTKYYVILEANELEDAYGNENAGKTIYFTTGANALALTTTYSPANNAATVSADTNITISFSESVYRYSSGATISTNDSYLKDCLVFKKTSSSGANVSYNASINATKKVITITPIASLDLNQKYYVAVLGNKLETTDGVSVPASSVTWTTGITVPTITNYTLTAGERTITAKFTTNLAGKVYVLPVTGSTVPTEAQILAGSNVTVAANSTNSLTVSNLTPNTAYTVYALFKSDANGNSAIVNKTINTLIESATLNDIQVSPAGGSNVLTGFNKSKTAYNVVVPFGTTAVDITAVPSGTDIVVLINGDSTNPALSVPVTAGSTTTITVSSSASGKTTTNYTINITVAGNTELESLSVDDNGLGISSGSTSYAANVPADATAVTIAVSTVDTNADIRIGDTTGKGTCTSSMPLAEGNQELSFTVTSNGKTTTYKILISRLAPEEPPAEEPPAEEPPGSTTPEAITTP